MSERYARMCVEHRRVLDELANGELLCPVGHAVAPGEHATLDRVKGTVTEPPEGEGEHTMPRPKRAAVSAEGPAPVGRPRKNAQLERTKFVDDAGATLWIRLLVQRGAAIVRWQRVDKSGKSTSGVVHASPNQVDAREAYIRALEEAEKQRHWRRAVSGRELQMAPIPDAVRKSRRAA